MIRINQISILFLAVLPCAAERKPGSPLEHLPKNMEIVTHFGERADFSPDNQRIAFMAKSFGDAFVVDLKTRIIRCLTCSVPGAAFLRIMHLSDGNYILIGPERFSDIRTSRRRDNELWFLNREPGSKPIRLGQKMSEGAAISKRQLKMAWSETNAQVPELARDYSRLVVADIEYSGGNARLVNKKTVYESNDSGCRLEAQDFYDNDSKMTFTCYRPKGLGGVMGIDLTTGKITDFLPNAATIYNEVEGIFPDGKYTLVESSRQVETLGGQHGSREIDIWKLRLDGSGKDFTRVTNFNDYQGWKASNPVVSTDGRYMAFQIARAADEAGVGYGIVLMRLN
jgi:Tol biopolymer transport system component